MCPEEEAGGDTTNRVAIHRKESPGTRRGLLWGLRVSPHRGRNGTTCSSSCLSGQSLRAAVTGKPPKGRGAQQPGHTSWEGDCGLLQKPRGSWALPALQASGCSLFFPSRHSQEARLKLWQVSSELWQRSLPPMAQQRLSHPHLHAHHPLPGNAPPDCGPLKP